MLLLISPHQAGRTEQSYFLSPLSEIFSQYNDKYFLPLAVGRRRLETGDMESLGQDFYFAILIQETCKINVYNTLYELNALKINFYNVNCIQCGAIV